MGRKSKAGDYRLAVCQFEPEMLDKAANLEKIADMARSASFAGAELIVFPECCVTGYPVTPELSRAVLGLAEPVMGPEPGPSVRALEQISREVGASLVVGLPERLDVSVANSAVFVAPDAGVAGCFRKVHLWEADREFFERGNEFPTFEGPAGCFGVLICYDLEFPESARSLALQGAQVVVAPTADMSPWQDYQRVFCRARAMENQIFFASANYIGTVESVEFFGGSIIADPYGRVLAEAGTAEAILVADIDLSLIPKVTAELQYLGQRRPEMYGTLSRVRTEASA
jgi:5-aminopentanamidase